MTEASIETTAPVATVRASSSFWSKVATLLAVLVPPLGLAMAMGLLWGVAFHWVDVVLLVGFYVICAFGTTIGFHRYFTHRGFQTRAPLKATLAILGCMTMQGPVTQWVTDHRKHHALSDKPGDPHSPHVGHGDGALGFVKGFLHAHVGWMFTKLGMEQGREYGRDLYEDRLIRTIDRLYLVWVVLTFGLPFLIGYLVGGTLEAGLEAFVWGGVLRIFLYQHATFSVDSVCHLFGRKDFPSPCPTPPPHACPRSPTCPPPRPPAPATGRGTTGSSRCPSSARAGTTPIPRSRARPATGCGSTSSTRRGG